MRESRLYGSVRGDRGNPVPYRDRCYSYPPNSRTDSPSVIAVTRDRVSHDCGATRRYRVVPPEHTRNGCQKTQGTT